MKSKIRNIALVAFALLFVLSCCLAIFGFVGCGGDEGDGVTDAQVDASGNIVKRDGYNYITYHYNIDLDGYNGSDDVYRVQELESGSANFSLDSSCGIEGYRFMGWYTDEDCTSSFSTQARLTSDVDLYALWYDGMKFEAEYTNLLDEDGLDLREFVGYSQNGNPLYHDTNASNEYYIGDIYQKGSYIYFEIEANKACSAYISLCVACEYGFNKDYGGYDKGYVNITSDDFVLSVNGTKYSYSDMMFSGAPNLSMNEKTSWQLIDLCTVQLKEGTNIIEFDVNNNVNGQGGTMNAVAPIIDYMMVYSPLDVTLSWNPVTSNITNYGGVN